MELKLLPPIHPPFFFQDCKDAAFCTRLRGTKSTDFQIDPSSLKITGPNLTATLLNAATPNASFALTLTSLGNVVRLHITEPSANPPRYEVPSVLLPESIQALQTPWQVRKQSRSFVKLGLTSPSPSSSGVQVEVEVQLIFSPISIDITQSGRPLLSWNAAHRLVLEHRREKQPDDPEGWWAENFKTHHDSKPRGPESISWDLSFNDFDHVYGLPERATSLSLRPTMLPNGTAVSEPYRLYNLDVFEYLSESPFGLYGAIPLLFAHRPGATVGAFWLNAAEMYVDVEKGEAGGVGGVSTQWIAESGVVDLFFLLGPLPQDTTTQYAALTGGTALPQYFALGYHQCRWNYKDQEDVSMVDAGFDAHDIPYDVLWLDIEHTDGKRYFTWDKNYFPTPAEMQDDVASRGRKMVTIVDPHIKRDGEWRIFKEATERGLFVKDKDGNDFDGWCWPGSSSYLDQTSSTVREWWADQFALDAYVGSTPNLYIWNDMNEPSVFNGPEITMHKDAKHADGAEHRDVHNVYGYFYHMATADGLRRRGFSAKGSDGDRPFVLSRAFFAGTQRIGAIWTGDNGADWDHLEASVPMLLSIGLAGLPFSGADVGGFFGNPDAELMTRWYQLGAFYPFFRGHAHLESKRREPWLFGEETTGHIRTAIRRRYRLLPYIYTLFLHANVSGTPIMRPLWYEFPEDGAIVEEDHVFMLGDALVVAPVVTPGATTVRVILPQGPTGQEVWYDGDTGLAFGATHEQKPLDITVPAPIDTIKHYIRGGRILPLKERARRSTAAMGKDPITLIVALNGSAAASGNLYLDDGSSYAFQRGQYSYVTYSYDNGMLRSVPTVLPPRAGLPVPDPGYAGGGVVVDKIVILGLPQGARGWKAEVEGRGGVEATPGPLVLRPGEAEVALVVRRAQLPAGKAWSVRFTLDAGANGATS